MKKQPSVIRICNVVCAVLMALLIVLQFVPYWYSVNGLHMSAAEYEDYLVSAPRDEEPEAAEPEQEEATEAATEAVTEEATEAVTEAATEAVEVTEVTEEITEATENTEAATEAAEAEAAEVVTVGIKEPEKYGMTAVLECHACKGRHFAEKKKIVYTYTKDVVNEEVACPLCGEQKGFKVLAMVEDFEDKVEPVSIALATWFPERGSPVMMYHVAILLLGLVCVVLCIWKIDNALTFLPVGIVSVMAIVGNFTNVDAKTGMLWPLHLVMAILPLLPALVLVYFSVVKVIRWFTVKER